MLNFSDNIPQKYTLYDCYCKHLCGGYVFNINASFIFLIDLMLDVMLEESTADGDEQCRKTKGNSRKTGPRSR